MEQDLFLDLLHQSRLLSDEQLAGVRRRYADAPTEVLALSLVGDGLLTPFQARQLTHGQAKGLVLGQYRLLEEIGRGGFGQVYKALHTVMDRVVAVKV